MGLGTVGLSAPGYSGVLSFERTAYTPSRLVFIGVTVLVFARGFRKRYLLPHSCTAGVVCADPLALRRQRIVFWAATVLMLGLLAAPWAAPLFY